MARERAERGVGELRVGGGIRRDVERERGETARGEKRASGASPIARPSAKRPLIIAGTSLGNNALIEAAGNIAKALHLREKAGSISLIVPEASSLGLAMLGGDSVDAALQAVIDGNADAIVVLENDLFTRVDAVKSMLHWTLPRS